MIMNKNSKIEKLTSKEHSYQSCRYVWLDVEKKSLYATNGCAMAVVPVEVSPDDHSGAIPVEAFELARKLHKKDREIQIDCNGVCRLIDGTILSRPQVKTPDFERILRKEADKAFIDHIGFNTDFLSLITEATGCDKVRLEFSGINSGIKVIPAHSPKSVNGAYGVLMPLRDML